MLRYDRSQYPKLHLTFPRPGSPEYLLLRQQAVDFLVEQSRAHQADAKLGIPPQARVVSDAAFRKVTANVHVTKAQVEAYFRQHRTKRQLDLGTAEEIKRQLLQSRRAAIMHGFVAAVRRDYPVTYGRGYAPVSETALAPQIWTIHPSHKTCDLRPGLYPYPTAVEHGCAQDTGAPVVSAGAPPCPIVDPPGANGGLSSVEIKDGYAEYATGNGTTCTADPRGAEVQVTAEQTQRPVMVSYLPRTGTATFKDPLLGFTLRYPRRFRAQQIEYGSLAAVQGVEVANYRIDPSAPYPSLSSRAVELTFATGATPLPGPEMGSGRPLPIALTDADLAGGAYSAQVSADGITFTLTIDTGGSPARRDVDALKAIVASIHFPPLRIGRLTPGHLYVLGRASAYPVGSVTDVPANAKLRSGRFYLEHAADGFWTVTWPADLVHGYKACGPHYDAKRRQFTCPSGAVWNFTGNVVKNPDPAHDQDDPLDRQRAEVFNGDVLVSLPPPA